MPDAPSDTASNTTSDTASDTQPNPVSPLARAHRTEIQLRFNDTDALGHLNNTSYALYAEQGRVDFLDTFRSEGSYLILAHISLDFLRQVRFRDSVYVSTRIAGIGRTSVTLAQDIYGNDELAARCRSVVVMFDYQAQKPVPVSDAVRAMLEPYVMGDADA